MAVNWNEAAVTAVVQKAAMAGVVSGLNMLQNSMTKKIMTPPKTGRVYNRGGRSHQASAPGEAPANDLGNLVASMRQEHEPAKLRGFVVVSAPYAAALELGALRMAMGQYWELEPRPYARPSVEEHRDAIQVGIQRNIREALDRFSRSARK